MKPRRKPTPPPKLPKRPKQLMQQRPTRWSHPMASISLTLVVGRVLIVLARQAQQQTVQSDIKEAEEVEAQVRLSSLPRPPSEGQGRSGMTWPAQMPQLAAF